MLLYETKFPGIGYFPGIWIVLDNTANSVVECGESGFGTFSHGNNDLLVRNGRYIASGVNAGYFRAAVAIDDNFTGSIDFYQLFHDAAVRGEANLDKNAVKRYDLAFSGSPVFHFNTGNFIPVPDNSGTFSGRENLDI